MFSHPLWSVEPSDVTVPLQPAIATDRLPIISSATAKEAPTLIEEVEEETSKGGKEMIAPSIPVQSKPAPSAPSALAPVDARKAGEEEEAVEVEDKIPPVEEEAIPSRGFSNEHIGKLIAETMNVMEELFDEDSVFVGDEKSSTEFLEAVTSRYGHPTQRSQQLFFKLAEIPPAYPLFSTVCETKAGIAFSLC